MEQHERDQTVATAPDDAGRDPTGPARLSGQLRVVPWPDPIVEQVGHDPRSDYVERFWLAVLGPSATWLVRRFASDLDRSPQGYTVDLAHAARSMGLGTKGGRHTPFLHSVDRTCEFGLARYVAPDVLAVRRRLPPLTRYQQARLPQPLREELRAWDTTGTTPDPADLRTRANRLALSMVEMGEDAEGTERQLHRWRFHPALAYEATRWAIARHQQAHGGTTDTPTAPPAPHGPAPDAA
jgi:hypothetical protein